MSSITVEDQFYTVWRGLGPKPQTTLRCFERGEIFTLHDSDALLVARDYFQNVSMIKHFQTGQTSLPYITIKKSDTEFLRHFLLRRQYRIEIYCGSTRTGRDNDWVLKLKASPGNLTQLEGVLSFDDLVTEGTGLTSITFKWWNDQLEIFTLHDSDALLVARDYFQNVSMIKHFQTGQTSLPYITIKKSDTEFLRHFLLRRQYRIEIYCGSTRTGRDNDWVLKLKASPGNLTQLEGVLSFDDLVTEGTGLTSITFKWWNDQLYVALAFCEKDCRRLVVGEFIDSVQLANLETALVQLNSRECLVPTGFLGSPTAVGGKTKTAPKLADTTLTEHLAMIFDRAGILVTELDKKDFTQPDVLQDLNYLLRHSNPNVTAMENKVRDCQQGLACLGAIIKFLDLKADESNAAAFSLHLFNLDNFVRLDSAATRALHLLPGPDDKHRYQSVFGVLNNCRTPQGQRLLGQWLRQPLTDINKIDERLDLVESLVEETSVRQSLHEDFLRRVPDFHRLIRRLQKRQSDGLQDVYRIYQTVLRLPHAINLLHQCSGPHSSVVQTCLIDPLQDAVNNFAKFQEMVESTIDLEVAQSRSEFIIRADFDDTLSELQNKLNQLEESIEEEFGRSFYACLMFLGSIPVFFMKNDELALRKLNLDPGKSVKLDSNEQLGYFMRVTLKEEKSLREFKSFQILDAQKGGVRFRNAAMSHLNDNHLEVKREYTEAQKSIVDEVLRIATGYVDPMYELNSSTALLDVIVSLAIAAVSSPGGPYVRPKLLPRHLGGRIVFKLMRHPCLEMQDTVSFIPNDVHLERGEFTHGESY
ncbi:hypothetical protein AHF37_02101 [Paragonimus kellicotti]|nr:hypothetical protein AHF37_02101 [Paragonimus kellicotti]